MALLKNSSRKSAIQALSVNLWNELQDLDDSYAESYLKWCIEKIKVNKLHNKETDLKRQLRNKLLSNDAKSDLKKKLHKVKHKNHPYNILKGDVVHVRFGVNLGDELSDLDSSLKTLDGHYGVVIAQKGFMFLIIPLTTSPQRVNDTYLDFYFDNLGLPGGHNKSYLAFAKMQFVHFRRIKRIHSIPEGKKVLSPEQVLELDGRLNKLMGLKVISNTPEKK